MALATVIPSPIAVQTDRTADYSLILAQANGSSPEASEAVLIFPAGVNTAVAHNAIAASATDATGLLTSPVALRPGCPYVVTCPNDGSFVATSFTAPAIIGPIIVAGQQNSFGASGATVVIAGSTIDLGAGSLGASDGIVRKSDLQAALTALAALCAPYTTGTQVVAPTATASTTSFTE